VLERIASILAPPGMNDKANERLMRNEDDMILSKSKIEADTMRGRPRAESDATETIQRRRQRRRVLALPSPPAVASMLTTSQALKETPLPQRWIDDDYGDHATTSIANVEDSKPQQQRGRSHSVSTGVSSRACFHPPLPMPPYTKR